jgi:uncharacterized protein (DUF697 family)
VNGEDYMKKIGKAFNTIEALELANRAKILKETKTMNEIQRKKAMKIIHAASLATAGIGAGLAQLPTSDAALIVPIQVTMVVSLAKVFNRPLKEGAAKSLIMQTTATMIGRGVSQWFVGWIPVAGNAINATTAFAITEILGWIIANEFSQEKIEGEI